jgi:hypothetical protein
MRFLELPEGPDQPGGVAQRQSSGLWIRTMQVRDLPPPLVGRDLFRADQESSTISVSLFL